MYVSEVFMSATGRNSLYKSNFFQSLLFLVLFSSFISIFRFNLLLFGICYYFAWLSINSPQRWSNQFRVLWYVRTALISMQTLTVAWVNETRGVCKQKWNEAKWSGMVNKRQQPRKTQNSLPKQRWFQFIIGDCVHPFPYSFYRTYLNSSFFLLI